MAVLTSDVKLTILRDESYWATLSHKQKKNQRRNGKRRLLRQKAAKARESQEILSDEEHVLLEKERRRIALKSAEDEKAWIEREKFAQEEFAKKRAEEEQRVRDKEELKQRIREEFEQLQNKEKVVAPDITKLKTVDSESREEMLKQFENLIEEAKEEEYSNPLAPASYPQYGTELDVKYCSFYLKTGACRFGDRCSRHHMKPPSSDTILLPAMFQHISLGEDFTNDLDTDSGLEHEESDTDKSFAEFFWDVFPEFQAVGQVTMFKVCCNHEPHLRGNVYVQYQEEREAVKAYAKFNGRFYASRQISCEFVKIEKWKSAICGQFHRMRCPKGKHCNFLHVFKNPGGLFMVHGSEVGPLRGGGGNLTSNGESAVRMLDNHPVVQAARNRAGCQPVVPMKPARQLPVQQSAHQCRRGPGTPGRFDQSPETRSRQSSRRGSRFHDSSFSYNRSHSDRKSSSVERSGRRGDRGNCRSERPHRSSPRHKRSRSSRRSRSPGSGSDRRRR